VCSSDLNSVTDTNEALTASGIKRINAAALL
jgi:hypothetical protein